MTEQSNQYQECFVFLARCSCLRSLFRVCAVMPRFTEQVEAAVEALSANSQPVDENEFIDASRLVYDGVRDIRKAVLMIRVKIQTHTHT